MTSTRREIKQFFVEAIQEPTIWTFLVSEGDNIKGRFSVLGGKRDDVDFRLLAPDGEEIEGKKRVRRGTSFNFVAPQSGPYVVEFKNAFSILTPKHVTLTLEIN